MLYQVIGIEVDGALLWWLLLIRLWVQLCSMFIAAVGLEVSNSSKCPFLFYCGFCSVLFCLLSWFKCYSWYYSSVTSVPCSLACLQVVIYCYNGGLLVWRQGIYKMGAFYNLLIVSHLVGLFLGAMVFTFISVPPIPVPFPSYSVSNTFPWNPAPGNYVFCRFFFFPFFPQVDSAEVGQNCLPCLE